MERIPYPKIIDFTAGKAKVVGALEDVAEFIVTEKIHGANFAFMTNGVEVAMASRNAILKPTDQFHNHLRLIEEHQTRILAMAQALQPNLKQLTIFGEIFGGIYPHTSVTQCSNIRHVQKGVFYAPDIHVRFFDIHIMRIDGSKVYLDWHVLEALCGAHGLPLVPVLFRGASMDACLSAIDLENLETRIPGELKLPKLEQLANIAEGVVIRPVVERELKNRSRAILKLKSQGFKEVHTDVGKHADALVEGGADSWSAIAVAYVTENRLRNVMSKDTTTYDGMGAVMALGPLLVADSYTAFKQDHVEFLAIPNGRQREVEKAVSATCFELLKKQADAILQGVF